MKHVSRFAESGHAIAELQLFRGVNEAAVAPLLADCAVVRLAAGEALTDARGNATGIYFVLKGALGAADGGADAAGEKLLPGECAGELSVLDDEAAASSIHALVDSEVLIVPAERLWRLIDESNGVARNLLRLLSFRVRAANAQVRRRQRLGEFYRQLSMVDALTGLQNRAWLAEQLPALISDAHATRHPLCVIMIDIDHFKRFNDSHGHVAGDQALRAAAGALNAALRPTDFAARYGGEELMVILPNADLKSGEMVAQRLCERMRQSVVFADMRAPLPHITASFGVACLAPEQDSEALIAQADAALYQAKENGRDRVMVAIPQACDA